MGRKIEALWDCAYCGAKGIGGLTKQCPNCGHPQDKDIKFYLPKKIEERVLDKETAKKYGKGADWMCSYCNSLNRYYETACHNCGADREEQLGDYFSNKAEAPKEDNKKTSASKSKGGFNPVLAFFLAMAAIFAFLIVFMLAPRSYSSTIDEKNWSRSIGVEECQTVKESDWSLPDGGRVYEEKEEIHHYDQVVDHYETVSVEKTREVLDGYDTTVEYVSNGDGTYDEQEVSTPRYRTETYYEDEERPVYKDVPVYQTKYYYEIDRWIETRSVDTAGEEEAPYWGQVNLVNEEREGEHRESYTLTLKTNKDDVYTVELSQEMWEQFKIGDSVKITVQSGSVTKINGEKISE